MKRNRSLNTTKGLFATTESSYVTTCFGMFLWPSSGYNLLVLESLYSMLEGRLMIEISIINLPLSTVKLGTSASSP